MIIHETAVYAKQQSINCYNHDISCNWECKEMKSLMVLIAGPYRGGTGDDPFLMRRNLDFLEDVALQVWRKGHIPVIGEWLALPLMHRAGSRSVGDPIYKEMAYPVAHRVLERCEAVLRVGGPSQGADQDVELAKKLGLKIFFDAEDVPLVQGSGDNL
jgi:hypothetical protein